MFKDNKVAKYVFIQMVVICVFFLTDIFWFKSFTLLHIFFLALIFSFSIISFFKSLENQLHMDMLFKNDDFIKSQVVKSSKDLLRHQRHDYMNLIQIVYGYLQLNKREQALSQIKWINSMASSISKAYRISIFSISMLLEEKIKKADTRSIRLEYNVYSKINENLRTVNNENQIIDRIDNIFEVIIQEANKKNIESLITIDIHEYLDNITFIFKGTVLEFLVDSLKDIYPYSVVENNIVKIKLKFHGPRGLNIENTASEKYKKNEFKSIDLGDYL